ncbi:DNA polymerase III subunit alpha [Acinetobacter baumannii]|uniref:DNA polymerase III subunit alpha n=1 Tax=Acinetobacter baumannii TaxID=470 RepID=UPI00136094FE|nr:DNA polymerase III subunit alpha [Acinetobacter baumannii]CAA0196170.1 DNA polymerase III, alpha subunit [Acinetobacter baumannii]
MLNHAMSVQSDFSIGKSLLTVDKIVEAAKGLGYSSVAIVDDMSLHALVDFSNKATKANIKPVFGCRLRVYDDSKYRKPPASSGIAEKRNLMFCPKVYVKSEKGIKGLFKLLTDANSKEQYYYHSRTDLDALCKLEDVVVTTGDMYGLFSHPDHERILKVLKARFGDDLYIEFSPINTPLFDRLNYLGYLAYEREKIKTVVTYPFNYLENEDADTLDVLSAIATNTQLDLHYRPIQYVKDFGFKEPKFILDHTKAAIQRMAKYERVNSAEAWKEGLKNISELVDKCQYIFEKQPVSLPKLSTDEFKTLCAKCLEGWKKRFSKEILGYKPTKAELDTVYKSRLGYELSILKKMGFESYFLLVEDLVMWSKNNGVIVGPGRGSVGGSLVAYLLGITDVDPIRFGLIFERFINPERLDLPDADLDFASSGRYKVIDYLVEKYGEDYVAGISNYSTLASASALRDTGRISGLNNMQLSATKLVLKEHGTSLDLNTSADAVPELDKFRNEHPVIWKHATKLAGTMKSFGQHAAGIVVAGEPIVNRAVLETRGKSPVVNWDKRVVEDWGLIKMDLLGLATLDVLNIACEYIKDRHGKEIDLLSIPLDDPKTLDAFAKGETTGVFQFESKGMKNLLREIAKSGSMTFEDISAATALYRPGPMDSGLLDDYVAVRQGLKNVEYDHPNMIDALKDTLGVIIYQEQVMKVSVDFAGFTNAEADSLRKAMGKKDKDKMAEMRQKFVDGAVTKSGVEPDFAGEIFDKIEAFAGYGFNKSHSVEYSIISMWCAYIRVHYPAEYFAASLSVVDTEDKLTGLVKDARECGIEILPPDINYSADRYEIKSNTEILAPFNAVKGISETIAKAIVKLREKNRAWKIVRYKKSRKTGETTPIYGPDGSVPPKKRFDSFEEFEKAASQPNSKVNKTIVENLRAIGAFASIEPSEPSAKDLSRRKDQMRLLPGLIIDSVKADRYTDTSEPFLRASLVEHMRDCKQCNGCDLAGQVHPDIRLGKKIRFMVVADCPTWEEEKKGKLLEGETAQYVKAAIKENELAVADGYYTTLVKAKKQDKFLTTGQINGCSPHLAKEIELLKPPVIVALGSQSIRYLLPDVKVSPSELVGMTFYNPKLDATIVCGLNPQQCHFDPTKLEGLVKAFKEVADIIS